MVPLLIFTAAWPLVALMDCMTRNWASLATYTLLGMLFADPAETLTAVLFKLPPKFRRIDPLTVVAENCGTEVNCRALL